MGSQKYPYAAHRLGTVASAEQEVVVEQMIDVVEVDPVMESWLQGPTCRIGSDTVIAQSAKQEGHGEIRLGPAPMAGRVNQRRTAIATAMDITLPQIAMQQGRGCGGTRLGRRLASRSTSIRSALGSWQRRARSSSRCSPKK